MKRLLVILIAFALLAAACGGSDDDDAGGADDSSTDDATEGSSTDDGGSTDNDSDDDTESNDDAGGDDTAGADEAAGGGDATGEGGGSADQELSEGLDLPECPVGAHLDADGVVEIDFWHPYTALTEEAMEDLATGFNASQDKIVVNVQAQGNYGELLSKYRESISFDDLPAVAIADTGAFRDMVDSGTVIPAQSCVEADDFDLSAIDEQVRAFYSIDGALYPAQMNVSTPVLYYNRDHFEAAGLDPDSPPSTLAEVRDAAQTIKDAGVAATPLSLLMQGWFVENWLTGAGVPLVNADNGRAGNATEAAFNGPEALELYNLLAEMNDAGLIVAFSNTPGQLSHYLAAVEPGTASMIIETSTASTTVAGVLGGTSDLSELVEQSGGGSAIEGATELNINIDVAPLPGLNSAGAIFISGGAYYITDSGSDAEKAAAWEFMKYISGVDQQKTIHLKGSYLPTNAAVLNDAEVQAVWQNDAAGQWLATAYAQLAVINPEFPGPAIGPFTEQRQILNRSLEELILGGGDPATILADAAADLDAALADYADANF